VGKVTNETSFFSIFIRFLFVLFVVNLFSCKAPLTENAVLHIQYLGKFAAVKMGVMARHGQGLVAGNFLDFQGVYVGHEQGGVKEMTPMVQGDSACFAFIPAYANFVEGGGGFLVHPVMRNWPSVIGAGKNKTVAAFTGNAHKLITQGGRYRDIS
jgi:hypothetical protein